MTVFQIEWITELEHLLRMLVAIILGFSIGCERKMRFKEAGIRTHSIVAAGSCLMMIISKYGFFDIGDADGARIAAQIVSGIGFIGAGMILYRKQVVHGLTTAAGIWATAGIGMAIGAGMYVLGTISTILIILIQCLMHLPISFFRTKKYTQLRIVYMHSEEAKNKIHEMFPINQFTKTTLRRHPDGAVTCELMITTDELLDSARIEQIALDNDFIITLERHEEE